jgi:predicted nucleic acid-binding protein
MLCFGTSSLIAYLQGETEVDVDLIDQALIDQVGVLSPVTVAELLSDPDLPPTLRRTILELPTLPLTEGFWERAGVLRAKVLRTGRRANFSRHPHRSKLPRSSCDTCHTRS